MNKINLLVLSSVIILSGCVHKKSQQPVPTRKDRVVAPAVSEVKNKNDESVEAFQLDDEFDVFEPSEAIKMPAEEIGKNEPLSSWQEAEEENQEEGKVIYFDYDRDDIRPSEMTKVQENAKLALQGIKDGAEVHVDGHACMLARSEVYNIALSQRRAMRVAKEYKKLGIPMQAMKVVGRGASQAICLDEDMEKQAVNRRVVTTLVYQTEKPVAHKKK